MELTSHLTSAQLHELKIKQEMHFSSGTIVHTVHYCILYYITHVYGTEQGCIHIIMHSAL